MGIGKKTAGISVNIHCFANTLNLAFNKAVDGKSVKEFAGKIGTLATFLYNISKGS